MVPGVNPNTTLTPTPHFRSRCHSQLKRLNQATVDLMAVSRSIHSSEFPNHLRLCSHSLITCNLHNITITTPEHFVTTERQKAGSRRNAECRMQNATPEMHYGWVPWANLLMWRLPVWGNTFWPTQECGWLYYCYYVFLFMYQPQLMSVGSE